MRWLRWGASCLSSTVRETGSSSVGVEHFHAHQLRHTFACRWLEAGGSLAALQEILGPSSIVTTQRYGRLSEAHVRAEAERIQGRLVTEVVTPRLREGS